MAAIVVIAVMHAVIGFVFGKYHERVEWNKLIKRGMLPKPK